MKHQENLRSKRGHEMSPVGAGHVLSLDQEAGYTGTFSLGKIHQAEHLCALLCILYFNNFFLFK